MEFSKKLVKQSELKKTISLQILVKFCQNAPLSVGSQTNRRVEDFHTKRDGWFDPQLGLLSEERTKICYSYGYKFYMFIMSKEI